MQSPFKFLDKKFPTFAQRLSIGKWQFVYYVLAAFNLVTVSSSLYLNHRIMTIYTHSIEVNHQWARRLQNYSGLGQMLADLNTPGNDVFGSQDIALESRRLETIQNNFQKKLNEIRQELQIHIKPPLRNPLLKNLDAIEATAVEMLAETQLIFLHLRRDQPDLAGKHMAAMDRKYREANKQLFTFRKNIRQVQQDLLEQQRIAADVLRSYQLVIAAAMLLMVSSVTFYGHKLAQKMKREAQQKEQSITELQQAETLLKEQTQQLQQTLDDLQKAQVQLVQSEKMSSLGELVAGVAHEINNPVNFIYGNLNHVRDYSYNLLAFIRLYQQHYPKTVPEIQAEAEEIDLAFLQEDLIKILDSMELGTDRIRKIVLSLRNFSRMDEADFKSVDIHEGIDSTLLILQHRLKNKSTSSTIEIIKDYGTLPQVECYVGQLNQVFMNILANAIDALEENVTNRSSQSIKANPSRIIIRTSVLDNQWIEIAIVDNGTGISEEVQERIFDPFFTTKPVGKGTGMGMSISYQIITEKHGGKLKCFSTLGQGTEFVIQIPIQQHVREVV